MSGPVVTDETTFNDSHSVTVPAVIRERLDISPGDELRQTLTNERGLQVEVVKQRYGALSDLEPVDIGEETDAVELEREFGRSQRPTVGIDSNVVIGHRLARGQCHDHASASVRGIDPRELPSAVLTSYCLGETLNIVGERAGHGAGVDTLDAFVESLDVEIVQPTHGDCSTGQAIHRRQPRLTFVDAITVAYMRREGLEFVYGFDDDFDRFVGITRLATAVDPFA